MITVDTVKSRITELYSTDPVIHANIKLTRSGRNIKDVSDMHAVIKGIYPNLFKIEETGTGNPRQFTFRYADVLARTIEIPELGIELAEEKPARVCRRKNERKSDRPADSDTVSCNA